MIEFVTRTWIKGNLKWLAALCALSLLLLASALATILTGCQPTGLALTALLLGFFLYVLLFTGLEKGLFLKPLCRLPGDEKRVALTFDDGPHPEHTPRILEALARSGVTASFFMLGRRIARHPDIARDAAAAGHDIGNHGFSHSSLRWAGGGTVADEVGQAEAVLREHGIKTGKKLFRPPHGSKSPLLEWHLRHRGYGLIHWNLSPKDWKAAGKDELLERMLTYLRPGAIILLHDLGRTADVLPDFIAAAREKGYTFHRVSDFL